MIERIDHAAEAREYLADTRDFIVNITEPSVYALRVAANGFAEAHVHATLALVEQQRIANLIALGEFRIAPGDVAHFRHIVAQPSGEYSLTVSPQIAEALGLS